MKVVRVLVIFRLSAEHINDDLSGLNLPNLELRVRITIWTWWVDKWFMM